MALTKSTRSQRSGTLFSTVGSTSTVRLNRPFAKGRMGIFGWSETGGPAIHESLHGGLWTPTADTQRRRSEEHTSELQSQSNLVCRLLLEKKKQTNLTISRYLLLLCLCFFFF